MFKNQASKGLNPSEHNQLKMELQRSATPELRTANADVMWMGPIDSPISSEYRRNVCLRMGRFADELVLMHSQVTGNFHI